jgi:hypothetical protein
MRLDRIVDFRRPRRRWRTHRLTVQLQLDERVSRPLSGSAATPSRVGTSRMTGWPWVSTPVLIAYRITPGAGTTNATAATAVSRNRRRPVEVQRTADEQ